MWFIGKSGNPVEENSAGGARGKRGESSPMAHDKVMLGQAA
jgi:hypothetical protein